MPEPFGDQKVCAKCGKSAYADFRAATGDEILARGFHPRVNTLEQAPLALLGFSLSFLPPAAQARQVGDVAIPDRITDLPVTIIGTSDLVVVVEAATNLANPLWVPASTNTLTGGSSYFSERGRSNVALCACGLQGRGEGQSAGGL